MKKYNADEAQAAANLTGSIIYLYSNGDHAAAGAERATANTAAGLWIVSFFVPMPPINDTVFRAWEEKRGFAK
jgi:hypothetical protein